MERETPLFSSAVSPARLTPSAQALEHIPFEVALRLGVLPLQISSGGHLLVVCEDPDDMLLADELRTICTLPVDFLPSPLSSLRPEIEKAYQFSGALSRLAQKQQESEQSEKTQSSYSDTSPAAEIAERLLAQALRDRASDIHIEPCESSTRVRFRIDGHLSTALELPAAIHQSLTARLKIMAGMDIAEKRVPQDGRIRRKTGGSQIDVRVSTLPGICGEKTVLRILDRANEGLALDALGCSPYEAAAIRRLLSGSHGLILNTGPIGSGKTTTLHAMMRELRLDEYNAITIEDPVEYRIPLATQVQVNEKSGLTFASALRSILRQDMDYLLIGEIRDAETAMLAVRAAITGHMILATLHCGEAASAPARLIDMCVPPYLLASCLRGVLSQRLLRRLCGECKKLYSPSEAERRSLSLAPQEQIYTPSGCEQCGGRGYKGRIAAFEIMTVTPRISRLILQSAPSSAIEEQACADGMKTMRTRISELVKDGTTSCEEALNALGE